jgi:Na+/H+-dicarboxylate symporter
MSVLILILMLSLIVFLGKKKVGFANRVLFAMLMGIGFGVVFKDNVSYIAPIGQVYVKLIKMIVIPLVTATIISSITSIEDPLKLKKIGSKTIGWLLFTTAIASIIGIIIATLLDPGAGIQFTKDASFKAREIPAFKDVLLDMIPANPVSDMAQGKIIPTIIFSIFIAIAISIENIKKPQVVKPLKDFFTSFSQVMFRVTKMVLKITPYGVLGLMASVSSEYGISTLLPLGKVVIAVYLACLLQILLVHGSLLVFVAKVNPLTFFKNIYPAQVVAFSSTSSYGTLPVTLRCLTNKVGVSEKIASFVAPMGATMGMNGCGGLYPAIVAIFVARVFNIPMTMSTYVLIVVVTTIASLGTAGVPGTASIMATVVLSSLGLPIEGIAMVLGIDAIIDMARTATNVTGASVTALLVASSENEFDRNIFNKNDVDEVELSA